jgi:primary-amine oxidase
MRRAWVLGIGGLALAFLPAAPMPGQDPGAGAPGKVSTTSVEGALTDLRIPFQKRAMTGAKGAPVPGGYLYALNWNGKPVTLFYYSGNALMLQHARAKVPVEKVNEWNVRALFSRAYNGPTASLLELALDGKAGATTAMVKQFLGRFDEELRNFTAFLGGRLPQGVRILDPEQRRVEVTFPTGKQQWQTAWKVEWDIERRPVPERLRWRETQVRENVYFRIKQAWFKPAPAEDWIQVLNDARVSELFVPYNDGKIRWYDVLDHGVLWKIIDPEAEAGPNGEVLGKDGFVVGELRDRGVAYKNWMDGRARRAQEFVLWANLGAGNYNYLIQYGFQDNGTISFQLGATGHNLHLGKKNPGYPRMGHVHNACWRLGIRLGPEGKSKNANTAYLVKHVERADRGGVAEEVPDLFNGGNEGFADWVAEEFTRVRIENPEVKMGKNREPIAYELVPLRQGTSRHYGRREVAGTARTEEFSLHDFWVTREDAEQFYYTEVPEYFARLKAFNKAPGKVVATNLVLWHTSAVLHDPRAEDGLSPQHGAPPTGPALTAWSGFELRPRHVSTGTPLFPPPKQ